MMEEALKPDLDAQARKKIRTEIDRNFFVEAGAGSGKTTMLVARMIAMVEAGVPVESICAITFTRAAANEFYSRFQEQLIEHRDRAEGDRRARLETALRDLDLCFMGTIDSFCSLLIREHPAEAGVPTGSRIVNEDELMQICRQEYYRAASGTYGNEWARRAADFRVCVRNPASVAEKELPVYLEHRHLKLCMLPEDLEAPERLPAPENFDEGWAEEIALIRRFTKKLAAMEPKAAPIYDGNQKSPKAFLTLRQQAYVLQGSWNRNLGAVLELLNKLEELSITADPETLAPGASALFDGKKSKKSKKDPGADSILYFCWEKNLALTQHIRRSVYRRATRFLWDFAAFIAEKLRLRGELTYFDCLLACRNMLKQDAEQGGKLISHVYNRHSRILIDEFQDTNPLQTELFFYLTAEHPVPAWRACVPRPGSLFIVGDPKQSIYRFRGADIRAYLEVRELFSGARGEVLMLSRNFRSAQPLLDAFNETFSKLMPEQTMFQGEFTPIPIDREGEQVPGAKYALEAENKKNGCKRVLRLVEHLLGNPDFMIREMKDGTAGYRPPQPRDIMIITPKKTTIPALAEGLTERGIPVRVEGSATFSKSKALVALCGCLSAIAAPADAGAVSSALRSAFRISDAELMEWCAAGRRLRLTSLPEEETESRVRGALEQLKTLWLRFGRIAPSAACRCLLEKIRLLKNTGTENLEYARYALELLEAAEINGEVSSMSDGVSFLRNLLTDESDFERCLRLKQQEDMVHIANLHKVKGLEAPIVILAEGNRRLIKADHTVVYDGEDVLFCPLNYRGRYLFEDFAEQHKYQAETEKLRLDYVAATRAKQYLFVSSVWSKLVRYDQPVYVCPEEETAARTRLPYVPGRAEELYEETEAACECSNRSGERPTYEIRRPSAGALHVLSNDSADANETVFSVPGRRHAAMMGTLVHRMMELLVSALQVSVEPYEMRLSAYAEKAAETVCREYDLCGEDPEAIAGELRRIGDRMIRGGYPQNNGCPQDLLRELSGAEEIACEVPFCVQDEAEPETLWNGVLDLCYRKNGVWHIVDYKTNADPSDLDEKYREQLAAYRTAFLRMTGASADALIYHIEL